MKTEILQKITSLCYFVLDDKECKKFLKFLMTNEINSARIYLDKIIEAIELQFVFDEDNEEIKRQLQNGSKLMDLVIELTLVNDREHRK